MNLENGTNYLKKRLEEAKEEVLYLENKIAQINQGTKNVQQKKQSKDKDET